MESQIEQQTDSTPTPEEDQTLDEQSFGLKHLSSILFAVGVTVGIYVFREQFATLDELAYLGAFLAPLVGNATVILPVPGLIVVYALGGTGVLNPLIIGLVAGVGAALGELTGYLAGHGSSAVIDNLKLYHRIKGWMERYGLVVIGVLAFIPNPVFDMAGMAAGAMRIKWWKFLAVAWIGKTAQGIFIAYAGLYSLGWVEGFLA